MSEMPDLIKRRELEYYDQAMSGGSDLQMLVLKGHLFSESSLERIILLSLKRGDRLIEKGNLSYFQKLALVEALDIIPDDVTSSLRNLNKLRNQCAHELQKEISISDITKLGSPLGKQFTKFKTRTNGSEYELLKLVIDYACTFVIGYCAAMEYPKVDDSTK